MFLAALPKPCRDLKLDNTLLEDRLGPAYVRICDFGFAKSWTGQQDNMKTAIGTPVYMSPQVGGGGGAGGGVSWVGGCVCALEGWVRGMGSGGGGAGASRACMYVDVGGC